MNGYMLLGEPHPAASNRNYRGTFRPGPTYIDSLPPDAPPNRLWMEETELMISSDLTLDDALRIQDIYAQAGFFYDVLFCTDTLEADTGRFAGILHRL